MKPIHRVLLSIFIIIPLLLGFITIYPRPLEWIEAWNKITLYEDNAQGERAVPYLKTILLYEPDRTDLWDRIATHQYSVQNFPEAIRSFEIAENLEKISINSLYKLGDAYAQSGSLDQAAQTWLRLVQRDDVRVDQLTAVTQNLRSMGDLDGALFASQRWHELDPGSTQAAWLTGLILSTRNSAESQKFLFSAINKEGIESDQAQQLLDVLMQVSEQPDPAYKLTLIGQRLADMQEWDIAEDAFVKAVNISPRYAEAWALLGEVRQHLEKDGWTALLRAKSLEPDSDVVLSALTLYWSRLEKYPVALAYLQELAVKHPEEGSWQTEIGSTLAQAGDMINAMAAYQQAVKIEPDDAENWQELAVFSATYGFDAEAFSIPAIEKALELAPQTPDVLEAAGWVYLSIGDLEKAEQFLQQALAEDGNSGRSRLHLAQIYIETNRLSLALPMLQAASTQLQDPTAALQAKRLMEKYFPGQ